MSIDPEDLVKAARMSERYSAFAAQRKGGVLYMTAMQVIAEEMADLLYKLAEDGLS